MDKNIQTLFEEVYKEELLAILGSFHKDKNIGPNGRMIEFYIGHFLFDRERSIEGDEWSQKLYVGSYIFQLCFYGYDS